MRSMLELDMPLRLKLGPTVMLKMRACLLTPDIQLSSPTLAFGPVQSGKCKVKPPSVPVNTAPHTVSPTGVSSLVLQQAHRLCFQTQKTCMLLC